MEEIFNKIDEILEIKKQIILYGVPGVGKTYLAREFANTFLNDKLNIEHEDNAKIPNINTRGANAHIIRDICYLISEGVDNEDKIIKEIMNKNKTNKYYWSKYPPTTKVSKETKIKSSLKRAELLNLIKRKNNKLILSEKGENLIELIDTKY